MHDKQLRLRYIRVLEKFFTRSVSLLKLENFDHILFKERTLKNIEEMKKTKVMDVHSPYLISLKNFLALTLQYIHNHSKSFENERDTLLKEANLLQKEKNKNCYRKDKHKNKKFDDGY